MSTRMQRFRSEAAAWRGGRKRGGRSYPPAMRKLAVEHAQEVCAAGGSVHRSARELGISEVTLATWLQRAGSARKLREVQVVDGATSAPVLYGKTAGAVEIRTANGHVVTGLSVQQAAELLRALS